MCFLLNHTCNAGINCITITKSIGSTSDVILLLNFRFWKPVYYKVDDSDFLSNTTKKHGRLVGIAEHVGNGMNIKIFTGNTQKIPLHSKMCSAEKPTKYTLCLDPLCGESYTFIKSLPDRNKKCVKS